MGSVRYVIGYGDRLVYVRVDIPRDDIFVIAVNYGGGRVDEP